LLTIIREIKAKNPEFGTKRVTEEVRKYGAIASEKRVKGIMHKYNLTQVNPSNSTSSKPQATNLNIGHKEKVKKSKPSPQELSHSEKPGRPQQSKHVKTTEWRCRFCPKVFNSNGALQQHLDNKHGVAGSSPAVASRQPLKKEASFDDIDDFEEEFFDDEYDDEDDEPDAHLEALRAMLRAMATGQVPAYMRRGR